MADLALRADNLGKLYQLGGAGSYRTFRDALTGLALAPLRGLRRAAGGAATGARAGGTLWALRGVGFEIRPGEIVGVIGRNGAGKSTLLKILSRITHPTEGSATIRGRVGSLLEVGTGFHPELTGRENIHLNGSIIGMRRREILRKFDEIVAFAEVEEFLDTPVKHYSSGMYMRLAFAVAAHLEPEILIIDEVLAVGDLQFQKKCLGKMDQVARGGRTILFVSHNMGAVRRLCARAILLAGGRVKVDAPAEEAIAAYVRGLPGGGEVLTHRGLAVTTRLSGPDGAPLATWEFGAPLRVEVEVQSAAPLRAPAVDVAFYAESGVRIFAIQSDRASEAMAGRSPHRFTCRFDVLNPGLACDQLSVDVGVRAAGDPRYIAWWQRVETIAVSARGAPQLAASEVLLYPPCEVTLEEGAA